MKRYRDCKLMCNKGQSTEQLLDIIEKKAIEEYKTKRYSSSGKNDTLAVYMDVEGTPHSRLVLYSSPDEDSVPIINIVPMPESGESHIPPQTYNKIIDVFKHKVFDVISEKNGNRIEGNKEDYTIEELIPHSYEKLQRWLSAYPLSGHQLDLNRWYEFVISLHENDEHLSVEDFGKYIKENYEWDDNTIDKFESRLESHLDLLQYYDEHRNN